MGTKLDPGRFDGFARALPDEPYFTLLARDPIAGFLVAIWSAIRSGDWEAAHVNFNALLYRAGRAYIAEPDGEQESAALDCAVAMFAWREANDGRWRAPYPPLPHPRELTLSRDEHEAIHRKLDLILEGQTRLMAQQDDLMAALTAIGGDVDTLKQHAVDLEQQLAAKADDLGIDLSAELTLAQTIRAKLEGVASAIPAPTDPAPAAPADQSAGDADQPATAAGDQTDAS